MKGAAVIIFLICIIILLAVIILCQQFFILKNKHGIQSELIKITDKISDILDKDTDEKIMVFTDNKVVMDLSGQINRLVLDRQKVKTDYRKQEISLKKMLANISHDIKTPLTVILGYLEILRLNDESNIPLQKVETKAKQVMELINQFFTFARLEAGDMPVKMEKVNINELCRESILGFYEILIQKEFTVDISIPENNLSVYGDREAVERILTNLISNAIRYGSDGQYIGISLYSENGYILIDICDKGKGIEKESAGNVFERLYTTGSMSGSLTQGSGLGLAIAKNLAKQMGGDIFMESLPGIKTVFTARLKEYNESLLKKPEITKT